MTSRHIVAKLLVDTLVTRLVTNVSTKKQVGKWDVQFATGDTLITSRHIVAKLLVDTGKKAAPLWPLSLTCIASYIWDSISECQVHCSRLKQLSLPSCAHAAMKIRFPIMHHF